MRFFRVFLTIPLFTFNLQIHAQSKQIHNDSIKLSRDTVNYKSSDLDTLKNYTFRTSEDSIKKPKKLYFSISGHVGSMLERDNEHVTNNLYKGIEARVGWQTDDYSKNAFDQSFRYPYYGFGYYLADMSDINLDNKKESFLGTPNAIFGFFGSPIIRTPSFTLNYDISAGFAFNFKTYDPITNPYNNYIGAKNNAYINLQLIGKYAFANQNVGLGISFIHFSNGNYQNPNLGINIFSATLHYQFNTFQREEKSYSTDNPLPPFIPTLEWQVFWGSGVKMLDDDFDATKPHATKRWYNTSISTAVLAQTSHRRKFGIGIDAFYFDWGKHLVDYKAQKGEIVDYNLHENWALGAFLAHELGYKKFWLITHLGYYLNKRVMDDDSSRFYERVGVKYMITPNLSVGVAIKAHYTTADYTEFTLGYTILKNKSLKKSH